MSGHLSNRWELFLSTVTTADAGNVYLAPVDEVRTTAVAVFDTVKPIFG
jgi:hypothetical protein